MVGLNLLFPLWVGLTRSETDPGFKGHFYFHYIFFQFCYFCITAFAIWGIQARGPNGSGSTHSDPKHSNGETPSNPAKKGSFPTFSVEELTEVKDES